MEYQHLSAEALQSQIQQTKQKEAKQKEAELKQAFSQHWKAEKIELAQEIRAMIEKGGHDVDDILDQLTSVHQHGRTGAKQTRKAVSSGYTRYVDPDNPDNVYVCGVLPAWMRHKMMALGLDPRDREDRDIFKTHHLQATQVIHD